jgi:hypothetical protein
VGLCWCWLVDWFGRDWKWLGRLFHWGDDEGLVGAHGTCQWTHHHKNTMHTPDRPTKPTRYLQQEWRKRKQGQPAPHITKETFLMVKPQVRAAVYSIDD